MSSKPESKPENTDTLKPTNEISSAKFKYRKSKSS